MASNKRDSVLSNHKTSNARLDKEEIELSIVIPLYNEEACLEDNVAIITDYLKSLPDSSEIILVNDGSRDNTADIGYRIAAKSSWVRLVSYPGNRGKGNAVKAGMLAASGKFRIFMDADLAVPVKFTGDCLDGLKGGSAVVIGSRHLPASCFKIPEGSFRTVLGRIYRTLTLRCFGLNVTDITCGLKGFSAKAAVDVFSRSRIDRWGYDAEVIFLAQKLGYSIAEIPVEWYHSFNSDVNVGRDSVGTLVEMLQILINYKKNRYDLH
jgi:glycosyltransferase involved in cell wall biosynthesis